MLNGIAPIIIFTFPAAPAAVLSAIAGIPLIGDSLAANVGLPIPIYLDEKLTGVFIDSESKAIDLETTVEAKAPATTPDYAQRGLNSTVTVNMKALKTSVALTALLAMIDMVFQRAISREYKITYLNGGTTIFNGLLDSFNVNTDNDNELVTISLTISKANQVIKKTEAAPNTIGVIGEFPPGAP